MKSNKTFIIAEAGVNHNGSLETAIQLVDAAADGKADAVKFQSFKAKNIVSVNAPKAEYQNQNMGNSISQFEMLKKLELSAEDHFTIAEHCKHRNIEFMSTPFDFENADLLEKVGVLCYKIGSGDVTNAPLLLKVAQKKLPIILSTGMCSLQEVELALGVIAYGYMDSSNSPSEEIFKASFESEEGKLNLKERVTLLHCTTEYPAPLSEVNLRAMVTLSKHFGLKVGFSDHTLGIIAPLAAVALGASIIEKHITLDKNLIGPDHKASLTPQEFSEMVEGIRKVEMSLGSGQKAATKSEIQNLNVARRSLVADAIIKEGDLFCIDNLAVKRPGTGISPFKYWNLLGQKSKKNYEADDLILL
jgi:N-acetylneuraminate synthase